MSTQNDVVVFRNLTAQFGQVVSMVKPANKFSETNAAGTLRQISGHEEVASIAKASGEALKASLLRD